MEKNYAFSSDCRLQIRIDYLKSQCNQWGPRIGINGQLAVCISKVIIFKQYIVTGLPVRPSYKFGFRSSVNKNGLLGEGRHEGLVPRNDVLTNGFIRFSLTWTLAQILFVPRLRPCQKRTQKKLRTWRRLFALFKAIRSQESLYNFFYCSSLSQLMMLVLGNSEKCPHCIQTHTPFRVGSH